MGKDARHNGMQRWRRPTEVGPYSLFDCWGRQIQEGDTITVHEYPGTLFRVGEIKPDLRPLPPGAPSLLRVSVTLAAVMQPTCAAGQPIVQFMKVRDLVEDTPPDEAQEQATQGEAAGGNGDVAPGPKLVLP